ncbi:hypothetical protein [Crocinitomix catalasitica]|uniref:hypothetical protein n=1 Tax=Crocinitomix catalasitica TaxID=184607 RepID=UPI0012F8DF88|nr:hypothetical protein [Crocinitomix catalasitica]
MSTQLNLRWKIVYHFSDICTRMNALLLKKRPHHYQASDLKTMPKNSMGALLSSTIEQQGLDFQEKLLRHDLKHVFLGYSMHVKDELRLHSFLLGNRNYNPLAIIYLFTSVLFVPDYIPQLRQDFLLGKSNPNLKDVELLQSIRMNLNTLREAHQFQLPEPLNTHP